MSRFRRIESHSRFFFITCSAHTEVRPLDGPELEILAKALSGVCQKVNVALCGYCLLPDHWHAILLPHESASICDVLVRIKTAITLGIARTRAEHWPVWQARFYDHILRTRREFEETLAYIHANPVTTGLVEEPLGWKWSSARWFIDGTGPVEVDKVTLPLNAWDRI